MITSPYQFWRDALAGLKPPMSPDLPELGFYRLRSKNKQGSISWKPVAYYIEMASGLMECNVNGETVSVERGQELWSFCGQYPVTEEAWREVQEHGGNWPDQDAIVAEQIKGIGHNSGVDEAELLSDQIKSAAAGKKEYAKVTSTEQADRSQGLKSRLLELAGQAKKIHKRLKDPHWDKCKEIDNKWLPLVKEAEAAAKEIGTARDKYLTEQLQKQRAAEAEAAESMVDDTPPPPAMPTQLRSAYGRAAAVRTKWIVKEITDYNLLYAHFKDSAAVKEALEGLAKKGVEDGEIPGVTREEVARS